MSGGHWQYASGQIRDLLFLIGTDERARARWPMTAHAFLALADILADAEHDMDWDLSADAPVQPDDRTFDRAVVQRIFDATRDVARRYGLPTSKECVRCGAINSSVHTVCNACSATL